MLEFKRTLPLYALRPTVPPAPHGPAYAKNVMFLCNHNSCRSQMADGQ